MTEVGIWSSHVDFFSSFRPKAIFIFGRLAGIIFICWLCRWGFRNVVVGSWDFEVRIFCCFIQWFFSPWYRWNLSGISGTLHLRSSFCIIHRPPPWLSPRPPWCWVLLLPASPSQLCFWRCVWHWWRHCSPNWYQFPSISIFKAVLCLNWCCLWCSRGTTSAWVLGLDPSFSGARNSRYPGYSARLVACTTSLGCQGGRQLSSSYGDLCRWTSTRDIPYDRWETHRLYCGRFWASWVQEGWILWTRAEPDGPVLAS